MEEVNEWGLSYGEGIPAILEVSCWAGKLSIVIGISDFKIHSIRMLKGSYTILSMSFPLKNATLLSGDIFTLLFIDSKTLLIFFISPIISLLNKRKEILFYTSFLISANIRSLFFTVNEIQNVIRKDLFKEIFSSF